MYYHDEHEVILEDEVRDAMLFTKCPVCKEPSESGPHLLDKLCPDCHTRAEAFGARLVADYQRRLPCAVGVTGTNGESDAIGDFPYGKFA